MRQWQRPPHGHGWHLLAAPGTPQILKVTLRARDAASLAAIGLNDFDHAKEGGRDKPEYPWLFYRGKSSSMGHDQPGVCPKLSSKFDCEAELAVVIGKTVPRHTSRADALQYVFGDACFNDMSVRDDQKRTLQWTRARRRCLRLLVNAGAVAWVRAAVQLASPVPVPVLVA